MFRPMPMLFALLLSGCGEPQGGGGEGGSTSSAAAKKKDDKAAVETGYCVTTFQISLLDDSGRAQVQVCLVTNKETREYILKHDSFSEKIRQSFIRIVEKNGLGELQMPGAEERVRLEMLAAVQEQMKPLVVEDVKLQRFELW